MQKILLNLLTTFPSVFHEQPLATDTYFCFSNIFTGLPTDLCLSPKKNVFVVRALYSLHSLEVFVHCNDLFLIVKQERQSRNKENTIINVSKLLLCKLLLVTGLRFLQRGAKSCCTFLFQPMVQLTHQQRQDKHSTVMHTVRFFKKVLLPTQNRFYQRSFRPCIIILEVRT